MKYLFNPEVRKVFMRRVDDLNPESHPLWGTMSPHDMVCHLIDHFNMAIYPRPVKVRKTIFRYQPFKWFAIYHAPIPKGRLKSPREMKITKPENWDEDVERLKMLVDKFAGMQGNTTWPDNPICGSTDGNGWNALLYRHADYHLKQFGC